MLSVYTFPKRSVTLTSRVEVGLEASPGSYVLKMRTILHTWAAAALLQQGRTLDAREQVRQAVKCAEQFAASLAQLEKAMENLGAAMEKAAEKTAEQPEKKTDGKRKE